MQRSRGRDLPDGRDSGAANGHRSCPYGRGAAVPLTPVAESQADPAPPERTGAVAAGPLPRDTGLVVECVDREPSDEDGSLLAEIRHGTVHRQPVSGACLLQVGLAPLGKRPLVELWRVPGPVHRFSRDGLRIAQGGGLLFASVLAEDPGSGDLAQLAFRVYTRVLGAIRGLGFPHPLRIWNVVSQIHGRNGGLERYRAFCVGRDRAFRAAGIAPERFPAATAVGSQVPGLLVYLLAGRTPGQPIENPRQVSAYRYPPRYGPRPPSFARALRCPGPGGGRLLVSGTASIVGHRSLHPGELAAQVRETLRNLDAIVERAAAGPPVYLKVFLRDPCRLEEIEAILRAWAPAGVPILSVQADVCRRELEVEIEAVCEDGCPAATNPSA